MISLESFRNQLCSLFEEQFTDVEFVINERRSNRIQFRIKERDRLFDQFRSNRGRREAEVQEAYGPRLQYTRRRRLGIFNFFRELKINKNPLNPAASPPSVWRNNLCLPRPPPRAAQASRAGLCKSDCHVGRNYRTGVKFRRTA